MNSKLTNSCPCKSGQPYDQCCGPYHKGRKSAPTALALMRSRYSAYALGLADYLILTTDPVSHSAKGNRDSWKKKILEFSNRTLFEDLTIISHEEKSPEEAAVTFIAHLKQGNKDASFKEESRFRKLNGQWLYTDGKVTDL